MEAVIRDVQQSSKQSRDHFWLSYLLFPLIYLFRRMFSTKQAVGLDKDRDKLELSLLGAALEKNLPVLGICRGAQLINIHLGGSLHQDLQDFYKESPQPRSVFPTKQIDIRPA